MKFLYTIAFLLVTFQGCAQKNAFERFHITPAQELTEENIQSLKIINEKMDVVGVATAVYLNKVEPKVYKKYEYFYIYLYNKNKNEQATFSLNGVPAFIAENLSANNEFTHLTSFKSKWNNYYFVKFQKQDGILHLKVSLGKNSSTFLFKKDQ